MKDNKDEYFEDYMVTTIDPGPMLIVGVMVISMSFFVVMVLMAAVCKRRQGEEDDHEMEKEQHCALEVENDGFKNNYQSLEGYRKSLSMEDTTQTQQRISAPERHGIPGSRENRHSRRQIQQPASEQTSLIKGKLSINMEDGNNSDSCDSDSEIDFNVVNFSDPATSKCGKLQIIACHNCDPVTRSVARLSVPFLLQAVLSATSEIIRLALVGHQLGTMSLSAFVVVDLLLRLTGDAVESILSAGNKMITQVTESDIKDNDNSYKAGRYLQLSIVLFAAASVPLIVFWSLCMDKVLLFLGYDSDTAEMGRQFAIPYSVGSLFTGVCYGFRMMLDVVGYEVQSTYLTAIEEVSVTAILAVFLCWQSLVPNASLVDLGYVFLISDLLYVSTVWAVIHYKGWLQEYMEGFAAGLYHKSMADSVNRNSPSFSNARGVRLILRNASSLAFVFIVYHGEWQVLIFFARYG